MSEIEHFIIITSHFSSSNILLELNWAIYNSYSKKFISENIYILQPENEEKNKMEVIEYMSKVPLESYETKAKVLSDLNNSIKSLSGQKYCLYNSLLTREILINEMNKRNIIPSEELYSIQDSFIKDYIEYYKVNESIYKSISNPDYESLIRFNNLQVVYSIRQSVTDLQFLVRLLNKSYREGFKFVYNNQYNHIESSQINQKKEIIEDISHQENDNDLLNTIISYENSHSQIKTEHKSDNHKEIDENNNDNFLNLNLNSNYIDYITLHDTYYIKVIGIEEDFIEYLYMRVLSKFSIPRQNLQKSYDTYGNFINEVILMVNNELDYNELLNILRYYVIKDINTSKDIIFNAIDSSNIEFSSAKASNLNRDNRKFMKFNITSSKYINQEELKGILLLNYRIFPNGIKFMKDISKSIRAIICFISNKDYIHFCTTIDSILNINYVNSNINHSIEESNMTEYEEYTYSNSLNGILNYLNMRIEVNQIVNSIIIYRLPFIFSQKSIVNTLFNKTIIQNERLIINNYLLFQFGAIIYQGESKKEVDYLKNIFSEEILFEDKTRRKVFVVDLIDLINHKVG